MADTPDVENPGDFGLTEEQARGIGLRYQLLPSQLRQKSESLQKRILSRIRFADLPRRRAEFLAAFQRGDDGRIAPGGFAKARKRLEEMREEMPASRAFKPKTMFVLEPTAGLAPDNTGWQALGPGNIGGRIRSILINPNNTQNVFIGSVGGGVWITNDGGQTWQPGDDLMANLAVCSLAMVPNNPNTLYAGTGEGYTNNDAIQGDGIFKTTDGWVWQQLESTKATPANQDFLWVNGLAINADGVILAGTRTGVFRSTDGGANWSKSLSQNVGNILFDPADRTKAVAGMLGGGGIYYSTDGGTSWVQAANPAGSPTVGRIQVCYAAQDTDTVYASVQASAGADTSQIWVSSDGGRTFAATANAVNYLGTQGWYDNIIWAGDPTDKNFVIVGGIDLYKSTDGGTTLTQISNWQMAPRSAHADHHAIYADPRYDGTTDKTVYFGNDGGFYKTTDVSTVGTNGDQTLGWICLDRQLPITQFYSGCGKFTVAGNVTTITGILGGAQDNGTLRYTPATGADAWSTCFGGDGGYVASDPNSADNYYGEYVNLQIFRSTDGGASGDFICGQYWDGANWVWKPAPYTIIDAQLPNSTLFISPFALDPNNSNCLLGGGSSLWRTNDPLTANSPAAGPSWSAIKAPIAGGFVSAIAVAPGNSDLVLVGYNNGQIYKSTNATSAAPAWTRSDSGINATRICTWLAIDKTDNNRFYATFGGFQAGNVWTSADGGTSWTDLSASLPQAPIYCVAVHPQNAQWLYLATQSGVFASEDRGLHWAPNNEGPSNCLIYQLFWLGNILCCASHGRGVFAIDATIEQQASLVLTGDFSGTLTARDAQTGASVSTYAMASGQIAAAPLVDGVVVYCGYQQPFAVARFDDAGNLSAGPSWQAALGGAVNAMPWLVKAVYPGDPDVLFCVAADGKLHALNAASGAQIWELQVVPSGLVGAGIKAYSNQVMNQWVYIATEIGFYAVNTQTRSVGWSTDHVCTAPPLLAADSVFVPTSSGNIHSLVARTGAENWHYDTGLAVGSTPTWLLGSVIAGNQAGTLVGLDYIAGTLQFRENFEGEQIQAIATDGNDIYFAGNAGSGHLYAYRLTIVGSTRMIAQTWKVALTLGAARAPQIVGTSLYLSTTNSKLLQFDTAGGASGWQQALPRVALAEPPLVYA